MVQSDEKLSLWEHVSELRTYFFFVLAALLVGAGVTHAYHDVLITALLGPLGNQTLIFLSPLDPLLFILKVDFFGGLFFAFPVILFSFFRFIAPALGTRNSAYVGWFCLFSSVLVVIASTYTYLLLLPLSIQFLLSIQVPGVQNLFTATEYIGFAFTQLLLMVIVFQIPSVVVLLSLAKVLNPALLAKNRSLAYLAAIIGLAVLTPTTDLYSLFLFLVPTLVVFEASVLLGRVVYSIHR